MGDTPTASVADVVVVGAGPAGLATARALGRAGRRVVVLEQESAVASSWRGHRSGLRLRTVRRLSGLPGAVIPRAYGQYVLSADLVTYFERYAVDHGLDVRFGVAVSGIERTGSGAERWTVRTGTDRCFTARTVVVATGYNHEPHVPDVPGRAEYRRPLLHLSHYRGGAQFRGQDVLVVGSGNAASEALAELTEHGAARVRMAVRTPPHIVRRRLAGVSAQRIAVLVSRLPTRAADRVGAALSRLTVPALSARNLQRPRPDLYTRAVRDGSVPVHDWGIVGLIASGAVEPVAGLAGFEGDAVRLSDGALVRPDVVLAATGYRRALEGLVPDPELLDARGNPVRRSGVGAYAGLHFVGFRRSASGALRDIAHHAVRVAEAERAPVVRPSRTGPTGRAAAGAWCATWFRSFARWRPRATPRCDC
jgi:putative flavoprotein involved in K+ transport